MDGNARSAWLHSIYPGAVAALGALVIFGWHAGINQIVQMYPGWVPMQYNTALCFLLAAGFIYTFTRKPSPLRNVLTASLFGIPCITLMQYLFQIDVGIDQLFMQHYLQTHTSHPGRMAPNTALAFMLIACTGWLNLQHTRQALVATALCTLTLGLGVLALLGYLTNLTPAYGWGQLTAMAAHTAIGLTLISTGLLFALRHTFAQRDPLAWQLAFTAPLLLVMFLAFQLVPIRAGELWQIKQTQADIHLLMDRIALKLTLVDVVLSGQDTRREIAHTKSPRTFLLEVRNTPAGASLARPGQSQTLPFSQLSAAIEAFTDANHYSYQLLTDQGVQLAGKGAIHADTSLVSAPLYLHQQTLTLHLQSQPDTNHYYLATRTFVLVLSLAMLMGAGLLFRSIHRHTQAEARAAQLYVRFKRAIDTIDEGFAIVSRSGHITDKNNRLSIAHATHIDELLTPTESARVRAHLQDGAASQYTQKTTNKLGNPIAISLTSVPGSQDYLLMEADLQESIGHLKAIEHQQAIITSAFDASTNGICVLDSQLNLVQVNRTFRDWLANTQEHLVGKPLAQVIAPEPHADFFAALAAIATQPGISEDFEVRLNLGGNRTAWMQARAASQFSSKSKAVLITLSFMCIDQRKQLTEKLNRTIVELSRSNEELDQFAYVASHDLKSPLVGIKNISEWLDEDYRNILPEEGKNHLTLIRSRCQRMMTLLDDLLAYSRAGRLEKNLESIALKAFVTDIVNMYDINNAFQLECTEITLTLPRIPVETLLRNLVNNSIKHHHRERGKIFVEVTILESQLQLTYSDDGPGVPAQYFERIMRPFTTLAPKDRTEGSGMGLAIIAKVVQSLNGSLQLLERPDTGLSICIQLPLFKGDNHDA